MLGAQLVGIAVVPLNTRFTGHEAAEILARSRATGLVLADGFLGKSYSSALRGAAAERGGDGPVFPGLPHLHTVVTIDARAAKASSPGRSSSPREAPSMRPASRPPRMP